MIKVTREEFYKRIGPLNVKTGVIGDFPYTVNFKLNGNLIGKTIDVIAAKGKHRILTNYYLKK